MKLQDKLVKIRKKLTTTLNINSIDLKARYFKLICYLKLSKKYVKVPENWKNKIKYLIENKNSSAEKYYIPTELRKILDNKSSGFSNYIRFKNFFVNSSKSLSSYFREFGQFYTQSQFELFGNRYLPGLLTSKLRLALSLSVDSVPPWCANFKRFGLPPSYPYLDLSYGNAIYGSSNYTKLSHYYRSVAFSYWC
mmetsp:Transcript_5833/g.8107  ORF Transcript_5833/g.8107 Transcript_5833/m.8107 type:complete len:194 (+) Transcript_5833:251-832(+)